MARDPRSTVITGASSGIGAALAVELGRRGARLALLARRADALAAVATRACAAGAGEVLEFPVDVTDRDAVRAALAAATARFGAIDVLILNAGISENLPVEHYDDVLAARILDVNLTSAVHAIGAVLPAMVARRSGHLVAVSSVAGYRGLPGSSAYCASKAGLSTLMESLRNDLRRHRVAVTTVTPGFVRTPLTDKNAHPMPFRLDADAAARRILGGIDRRRREVRFPWPLVWGVRLLRALPDWLFDRLASRYQRPPSRPAAQPGAER